MDIALQVKINTSTSKVFEAITTAQGIHGWWSQNSAIASQVGQEHIMYFVKNGQPITMKFKINELHPGQKVVWTCSENGNPAWVGTQLAFELEETNDGTQLTFKHSNWDEQFNNTPLYVSVPPTWEAFMNSLKSYCETGVGQAW